MKQHSMAWIWALLVSSSFATAGAAPSILKDVRYTLLPGVSRLSLSFEGPVSFSPATQGAEIVLTFSHTRVSSPPGAARLSFKSGLIRSVAIDRLGPEITRVTVTMRENASYKLVRPTESQVLYVEASARPGPQQTTAAPQRTAAGRTALHTKKVSQESPLVDIPALARTEAAERAQQALPAAVGDGKESPRTGSLSPLVLLGSMIGLAVLGTLALLGVAAKKQTGVRIGDHGGRREAARHGNPPVRSDPPPVPVRPETDDIGKDEPEEEEQPEIENNTEQLAKMFRRGQEELRLVARLHASGNNGSGTKVARACSSRATRTQRTHAAKKLGIGRGEIDLAIHLRALEEERLQKEETL